MSPRDSRLEMNAIHCIDSFPWKKHRILPQEAAEPFPEGLLVHEWDPLTRQRLSTSDEPAAGISQRRDTADPTPRQVNTCSLCCCQRWAQIRWSEVTNVAPVNRNTQKPEVSP